ncbi:unnamed protein product [Ambrosiozyma monospora]|uniref:Unnamed protein product n=1 Tax=Ambrosiozyma monospora TaxID=43982 RepID=A0A9W6WHW4_AMBMO|nr:unnamed protein product [Ambrosiozyma monospora]
MVNYLYLKAELNNVTDFTPADSTSSPFEYTFKIQCTKCREMHDKDVSINLYEQHELPGSRGEANFYYKCSYCSLSSHISISLPANYKGYTADDNGKDIKMLAIDSRGVNVMDFVPVGFFKCVGVESGNKFEVEFEDGEWYDYDDEANQEVSITDVIWEIRKK